MFTRLATFLRMRRSTAFLLARGDDRLLDDIGLSRAALQAMHLGLDLPPLPPQTALQRQSQAWIAAFPAGGALPVPHPA